MNQAPPPSLSPSFPVTRSGTSGSTNLQHPQRNLRVHLLIHQPARTIQNEARKAEFTCRSRRIPLAKQGQEDMPAKIKDSRQAEVRPPTRWGINE